ncbi:MAG: DUF2917 domain-containing protein [Holophaga sp.]|nr:DUF2917 domain-containing protein [Holophaga sp.]
MTTDTIKQTAFGIRGRKSAAQQSGLVGRNRTQVLKNIGGRQIRCTGGSLWVTIEGDPKDYVLTQNQSLAVPNLGKVILSGPGSYQV